MNARSNSSALWGLVGALLTGVLLQGYNLFVETAIAFTVVLAVSVVAGGVTAVVTYVLASRVASGNERV